MRTTLMVVSLILLLAGCNQGSQQGAKTKSMASDPMCNPTPVRYFHLEQQAKAIAEQVRGVDRAVAVQIDDELDVAVQVTNFHRLRLKAIREEVAQKLRKAFPQAKVHVTSDKRLIMDLQKLSETPWSTKQEEACKQKKKLKQIEEDMKG